MGYMQRNRKLECELDDLRQERSDLEISWQVKCDIEELEEQNKTFRVDRNNKIDAENKLHEKNIQEINQQYGM